MRFPSLFSPITIGPAELRNRLVLSAMTTGFGYDNGAPTDDLIAYFRVRCGGIGMATVAFGAVRPEGRVERQIPWMWLPDAARSMAPLAAEIAAQGAVPCLQLGHGGRQVSPKVTGETPVGPSPVPPDVHVDIPPRELTTGEVEDVIGAFAVSAERASEAGFGAVELHGAHGYLVQQFLSPVSNRRSDRFGSDRARFGVEVIEAIRSAAPGIALIVRINGSDLVDGGMDVDDAVDAARRFTAAGAHALLVSAGVYGSVPYTIPLLDDPEGCFLDLAATVKGHVSIPVIGVGRVTDPAVAEAAISAGQADAIAVGRALLADPDWVQKAEDDRMADMRPCIATVQGCAGMLQHGDPISCAVNPEVGRELRPAVHVSEARSVLVVGGGPAGMEAARRAAELGHSVTLAERSDRLGGQLRWAAATPPLGHLSRLIAWYERQLERLGVTVQLGSEPSHLPTSNVIWATGATIEVPAIDGFDALPTWTTETLFEGEPATTGSLDPGDSVAVVGSGQRALAVALYLATGDRRVSLLHADRPGGDTSGLARRALLTRCDRQGVERIGGRLSRVTERGVVLDGDRTLDCTGLVLVEPLRPEGSSGRAIGDGRQPRDIAAAIAEGRQAAEEIA